ncbi:MAG TPA: hypothetical protein VGC29_04325 [Flavisolibacter sp.]
MQRKTIAGFFAVKNFPQETNFGTLSFPGFLPYLSAMFLTINRTIAGLFIILLAGAVYFNLERMLFCDASFILTRIINQGTLQVQEHRYGSFITQAFPLLASYLDLPLSTIVTLYSVSFNIFYLVVALLLVFSFKEHALAILMSLYYVLFVTDTYFWTNNEVHQGIAWMFLFFATIGRLQKNKTSRILMVPVFLILAFLAIFTHPLVLFPIAFLWIFLLLEKKWNFNRVEIAAYSILLAAICVGKYMVSTSASQSFYDIEKLQGTSRLSLDVVVDALNSPLAKEIARRMVVDYWIIPLLLIAGLVSAIRQKKYLNILLTILFVFSYLAAICITFTEFEPFYMESELMALSIISSALFVYYTIPQVPSKWATTILLLIFLVRLGYIYHASGKWVERKKWLIATLEHMRKKDIRKGLVYETGEINKILVINWGVPQESLLASAIHGDDPQLTFVVGTRENLAERIPSDPGQAIGSFKIFNNDSLNARYFSIDTTSFYRVVEP